MEDYLKEFRDLVKVRRLEEEYSQEITPDAFFGFPLRAVVESEKRLLSTETPSIAYLSMEYGLATSFYNCFQSKRPISELNMLSKQNIFSNIRISDYYFSFHVENKIIDLPIYSGGLGVLAGDTLKSAADMKIPFVGVGILWRKGYFKQNFWYKDGQVPEELDWDPDTYPGLIPLDTKITISLKDQELHLRLWKYYIYSYDKEHVVPLILLDSNLEENKTESRGLTNQLYRSDNSHIKIMQRLILGTGGIKALEALGYNINKYHLNEGHAAMALVEKASKLKKDDLKSVGDNFIFTCHTPVAAGHDRFPVRDLERVLPDTNLEFIKQNGLENSGSANFTILLMNCCKCVNAVSKKHGEITRMQFPQYSNKIQSITNGVHISTWISPDVDALLNKYKIKSGSCLNEKWGLDKLEELRKDGQFRLDLWNAHQANKRRLRSFFENWGFQENVFTLCWARRIAAYKRPSLIFTNPQKLAEIAKKVGPIQIFIAGKAHPNDSLVGTFINDIMNRIDALNDEGSALRVIMLENYDIFFGKLLTNSVDVWLNNPLPPFEASGTSGMKAILNGVLQLSTLDGWVVEAADHGIGEIFGYKHNPGDPIGNELDLRLESDSAGLYDSLEKLVKSYYEINRKDGVDVNSRWIDAMINCLIQGHYFNTCRMVREYHDRMWLTPLEAKVF